MCIWLLRACTVPVLCIWLSSLHHLSPYCAPAPLFPPCCASDFHCSPDCDVILCIWLWRACTILHAVYLTLTSLHRHSPYCASAPLFPRVILLTFIAHLTVIWNFSGCSTRVWLVGTAAHANIFLYTFKGHIFLYTFYGLIFLYTFYAHIFLYTFYAHIFMYNFYVHIFLYTFYVHIFLYTFFFTFTYSYTLVPFTYSYTLFTHTYFIHFTIFVFHFLPFLSFIFYAHPSTYSRRALILYFCIFAFILYIYFAT